MGNRVRLANLVLGGIIGCSQLAGAERVSEARAARLWDAAGRGPRVHVVFVALDGTRWQEIFHGTDDAFAATSGVEPLSPGELVPNLTSLARRGVALGDDDAPFEASGPNFVSLPGYAEMLTGHATACQENDCSARPDHTIADTFVEAGAARDQVVFLSSWERIDNVTTHAGDDVLVSAGRTGGATRDVLADDPRLKPILDAGAAAGAKPGHDGYRPDRYTSRLALEVLETRRPRFMFVSLGDTDEYAHAGDYRNYVSALHAADGFLGEVARIGSRWEREGDTVMILVTSDHGREASFRDHGRDHPESARTWLVAAGGPFAGGPRGKRALHRLSDIAPTIEAAIGAEPRPATETGVAMTELFADPRSNDDHLASLGIW
jgi:hypothetical protein